MALAQRVPYLHRAMPLIDLTEDCSHSNIEHLGNDHDARFFRCERCRQVFVAQGGMTLAVPAVRPQRRPQFEPAAGADAEVRLLAERSASE
jgi:hypothetical protein